jgi:uncharacterized coiled-coil protein SlyX
VNQKQIVRALDKHRKAIADERDKMRDLLEELQAMDDGCSEAVDGLEQAIESLSERI